MVSFFSCSHQEIKPWGSNTTFSPGWEHVKRSAKESVLDSETWVPLVCAATFGLTTLDEKVADYALDNSPLFGDRYNAVKKSNDLFESSKIALLFSSLATAGAESTEDSVRWKFNALTAQSMAIGMNNFVTAKSKIFTKRTPPNQLGSDSLTSRHASGAFLYSGLTRRHMRYITTRSGWHKSTDIGMIGLASLTAWGRVEGGLHYPSDVFVGAALGNFFANFVYRAFIDPEIASRYTVQIYKTQQVSGVFIKFRY